MGEVYLAEDNNLQRNVSLKMSLESVGRVGTIETGLVNGKASLVWLVNSSGVPTSESHGE